jgi:hypothetical protein
MVVESEGRESCSGDRLPMAVHIRLSAAGNLVDTGGMRSCATFSISPPSIIFDFFFTSLFPLFSPPDFPFL